MAHWKVYAYNVVLVFAFPMILGFCELAHFTSLRDSSPALIFCLIALYLLPIFKITVPLARSPLKHLPSPPETSFLLGSGLTLLDRPPGKSFLRWMLTVPNDGLIYFTEFFHAEQTLLLTTPEACMEVLNTKAYDYQKPAPARKFLHRVLGNGLVVSEGKEHKFQRKSVSLAFQGKQINALTTTFWNKAQALADEFSRQLTDGAGVVDICTFAGRITLDIIGVAGLGRDFNSLVNREDELANLYETIVSPEKGPIYFALNILLPPLLLRHLPWEMNQRVNRAALELRVICRRFVQEKKALLEREEKGDKDILTILIQTGAFTDDDLVDQLLTFLAAGHDTTSMAFTWSIYLLCKHQGIQDRLRSEIKNHLSHSALDQVDSSVIESMPYLHAFTSEALRFYPTVPNTARVAIKDTSILGQKVPKGTQIAICPMAVNQLPSLWGPDGTEFKPERWMGSEKASSSGGATNHNSFLTFIHGPRSCIGQNFARAELKCLLAATIARFHVEMDDKNHVPQAAGAVTIHPVGGLKVKLTDVSKQA